MDMKLNNSISSSMIKGESYNVLNTYEQFYESRALWDIANVAVKEQVGDDIYVLPYRGQYNEKANNQPGIYSDGSLCFEVFPTKESDMKNYKNIPIITISSNDNIEKILEKENVLSKLAEPWITSPDNITQVVVKDSNDPAMKLLKTAINSKHCDMDKYQSRFGQNYPNDKRQLNNDTITLKILERYAENLDMEVILTIRDKEPGVPNPLKQPISISLSTGDFLNIDIDDMDDDSSDDMYF